MTFGNDVIVDAISRKLTDLFPSMTEIDFEAVAKDIIEAVDIAAIRTINHRERQLQQTLQNLMTYYVDLFESNAARMKDIEQRNGDLNRKLCAYQTQPAEEAES